MTHYPTCAVWRNGDEHTCDCPPQHPWRVRQVGRRWEVSRYLDGQWTRFMRTATHESAHQLVASMQWLSQEGLRRVG